MKLSKRGNLVVGFIIGAITALCIQFFSTHHIVIDTNTCKQVDVGIACNYHYALNK